jgi:hypothetical protein
MAYNPPERPSNEYDPELFTRLLDGVHKRIDELGTGVKTLGNIAKSGFRTLGSQIASVGSVASAANSATSERNIATPTGLSGTLWMGRVALVSFDIQRFHRMKGVRNYEWHISDGRDAGGTTGTELAPALTVDNWIDGVAGWNQSDTGTLVHDSTGTGNALAVSGTISVNTLYRVVITFSAFTSGSCTASLGGVAFGTTMNTAQTYTAYITPFLTTRLSITPTNTAAFTISAISVAPITGFEPSDADPHIYHTPGHRLVALIPRNHLFVKCRAMGWRGAKSGWSEQYELGTAEAYSKPVPQWGLCEDTAQTRDITVYCCDSTWEPPDNFAHFSIHARWWQTGADVGWTPDTGLWSWDCLKRGISYEAGLNGIRCIVPLLLLYGKWSGVEYTSVTDRHYIKTCFLVHGTYEDIEYGLQIMVVPYVYGTSGSKLLPAADTTYASDPVFSADGSPDPVVLAGPSWELCGQAGNFIRMRVAHGSDEERFSIQYYEWKVYDIDNGLLDTSRSYWPHHTILLTIADATDANYVTCTTFGWNGSESISSQRTITALG